MLAMAWQATAIFRVFFRVIELYTSYFFSIPDNRPATAFYRERRHSDAPRGTMPTSCCDGSGTILRIPVGLDVLHIFH